MSVFNLISILGPTASGKTRFAAHLAATLDGEVISADSRQVYRGMDIGTGKDYQDYSVSDYRVPCHLVDLHDPGYRYNVYEYQKDFIRVYQDIKTRGKLPILAGGTGLYIQAVLDNYSLTRVPVNRELREDLDNLNQEQLVSILKRFKNTLHNSTDTVQRKRTIRAIEIAEYYSSQKPEEIDPPKFNSLNFGIRSDRNYLKSRISKRLMDRLSYGMIDEVNTLLKSIGPENLMYYGLEYKFITLYLTGHLAYDEMVTRLETAIHQFAKRQMTWFRRMEKQGFTIHWLNASQETTEKLEFVSRVIRETEKNIP